MGLTGQEDESWGVCLHHEHGSPWRGTADLLHFYHPPQPRLTRRRGSRESWELRKRYFNARYEPGAMEVLVGEARELVRPASPFDVEDPSEEVAFTSHGLIGLTSASGETGPVGEPCDERDS